MSLFNVIHFSPLLSLVLLFTLELTSNKPYMMYDKRYGILLSELYLIIAIFKK